MTDEEQARVQKYLRDKFANTDISLRERPQADGSVEVYIGEEFVGIIYKDDEEGDVSYDFNMTILGFDLSDMPGPG